MEDLKELARSLRASGMELDDVLAEVRAMGASPIDSIKIVIAVEEVGLGEAKLIVDASPAWAHVRESNRQLREEMAKAMDELEE